MMPVGLAPVERLYWLIDEVAGGRMTVASFCAAFEHIYNLEVDKTKLSAHEKNAFGALFEKVVWFSPIPGDRAARPHYLSEREIETAVRDTVEALRH